MRRASPLAAAVVSALCAAGFADAVAAQDGGMGRRPNPVIPHGGQAAAAPVRAGLTPAPGPARRTLTPANAWMQPAAPAPAPVRVAAAPPPQPQPQPQPRPAVDYLPDQGGRGQPAPVEAVYVAPPAQPSPVAPAAVDVAADTAFDPMAPRRDAPIFRMQQDAPTAPPAAAPQSAPEAAPQADAAPGQAEQAPQPRRVAEVVNTGEQPPRQGARYYSVHRQNGRQPDAMVMPASTYVDALAVTMTETPASQDLAQPDQGPTLIRDNQGRLRAAPAASDGDHQ